MQKKFLNIKASISVVCLILFLLQPIISTANGGNSYAVSLSGYPYVPPREDFGGIEVDKNGGVGTIYTTVASEDTLYLGGDFTQIGFSVGRAALISATTSSHLLKLDVDNPKVFAELGKGVNVSLAAGGYLYLGGKFFQVGDTKDTNLNLVRLISPSGENIAVDENFLLYPNGEINDLAYDEPHNILYVAGNFDTIGNVSSTYLAAIDLNDNSVIPFSGITGPIYKLALSPDNSILYVGGEFAVTNLNNLVAYDVSSSTNPTLITAWDPNPDNKVTALAIDASGSTLYVGGGFQNIATTSREYLAALNITATNTPAILIADWDPDPDDAVYDITLASSSVFIGGEFTHLASSTAPVERNHIAALDPGTSTPSSWYPNGGANGAVNKIIFSENEPYAYIGGSFTTIGGKTRRNLAQIDVNEATVTDWYNNTSGPVNSITLLGDVNEYLFIGGEFNSVCVQDRNYLAAIDINTNDILDFASSAPLDGIVKALAISPDYSKLFIGGAFNNPSPKLAAYNLTNNSFMNWSPNPHFSGEGTPEINALLVDPYNNLLFVGGSFDTIGEGEGATNLNNLASFGLDTLELIADWGPNPDGSVYALAIPQATEGEVNMIAVGGNFNNILNANRTHFALLNPASSTFAGISLAQSDLEINSNIRTILFGSQEIYIGGDFTQIGTTTRNYLASFDIENGELTDWDPNITATPSVYSLAFVPSSNPFGILVGGDFAKVGNDDADNLALIGIIPEEENYGKLIDPNWNSTEMNPDGPVYSLYQPSNHSFSNFSIFVGGKFSYLNDRTNFEKHSFGVLDWAGYVYETDNPDADFHVAEGGTNDNFNIRLTGQPFKDVNISFTSTSSPAQITIAPASVSFTPNDWYIERPITVSAIDDSIYEGNHNDTLKFEFSTNDEKYAPYNTGTMTILVHITDNDTAPIIIIPSGSVVTTTTTTTTKPLSLEDLQKELQGLRDLLNDLIKQAGGLKGFIPEEFRFKQNLSFGQNLIDVKYLQIILNSDSQTKVANSGPGSAGHETTYFGPLTKTAVIKFQEKYAEKILKPLGLTSGTGYVGPYTRTKLNSLLGK